MKKCYLALTMIIAAIMFLTGCGKTADQGTETDKPDVNKTETDKSKEKETRQQQETSSFKLKGATRILYRPMGHECPTTVYEYNELGRLTRETGTDEDRQVEVLYDTQENEIKRTETKAGTAKVQTDMEYEYDSEGNPIRITDKKLGTETRYEYDAAGNEISQERYDNSGECAYREKNEYNVSGNLISRETFFVTGGAFRIGSAERNEYNEKGLLIKKERYGQNDTLVSRTIYNYTASGDLLLEITCDPDGKVTGWHYYEYASGPMGMLSCELWAADDGMTYNEVEIDYVYDAAGNLLKKQKYYDPQMNLGDKEGMVYRNASVFDCEGKEYNGKLQEFREIMEKRKAELEPLEYEEYEYDAAGKKLSSYIFSWGDWNKEAYDADGRLLWTEEYSARGSLDITRVDYSYDSEGRLLKIETHSGDTLICVTEYSYWN